MQIIFMLLATFHRLFFIIQGRAIRDIHSIGLHSRDQGISKDIKTFTHFVKYIASNIECSTYTSVYIISYFMCTRFRILVCLILE